MRSDNVRPQHRALTGGDRRTTPGAGSSGPDSVASLGTTAKFQATSNGAGFKPFGLAKVDPETGEILGGLDPAAARIERYALQAAVRVLLPNSRTAKCLRYVQKQRTTVDVFRSTGYKRAHFGGLQTCASVWACPVCSAKISERRRAELQALIAAHEATYGAGTVLLNTKTAPHKRTDLLSDLLAQLTQAEASYKAHRDYKAVTKAYGLVGTVKATEVTYGDANGFHPHIHELMFFQLVPDLATLEDDLSRIWTGAAVRAGFDRPSRAHGLQLQDGSKAAKYASKWGLESELTQWHRKRGKLQSRTPFDLLRDYIATRSAHSGHLFRVYAEAFHGRHQLQFSRGLKDLYGISEVTDDDLVQSQDEDAILLGQLDLEQWRLICKTESRGLVLECAANGGWDAVVTVLDGLQRFLDGKGPVPPVPSPDH